MDTYCSIEKSYLMLKVILYFNKKVREAIANGAPLTRILRLPVREDIARMKIVPYDKIKDTVEDVMRKIDEQITSLVKSQKVVVV
ncbi:hypothetical protein DSO05_06500 [Candidatus Nezhaarchaeota archaeon WYZ-LMO7]|nr:MAG: hypothetical protein DSO05_06500 [Candidatus Nezhaarchaeota archaeon WYZ-LMO7]